MLPHAVVAVRLREDPPVLSQGLTVTSLILVLYDGQEPPELGHRLSEPSMILVLQGAGPQVGRAGGSERDVVFELSGEPVDRLPEIRERVGLEEHQTAAEAVEPVDEIRDPVRGSSRIGSGGVPLHMPGQLGAAKSVVGDTTPVAGTPVP